MKSPTAVKAASSRTVGFARTWGAAGLVSKSAPSVRHPPVNKVGMANLRGWLAVPLQISSGEELAHRRGTPKVTLYPY